MITLYLNATLDGKQISYTSRSQFTVQIGRYAKGSYKVRWRFVGKLAQAVAYFNDLNIGNGYKKRLVMHTIKKNRVLARQAS